MAKTKAKDTGAELAHSPPPRDQWFDRIVTALVHEYAQPPESRDGLVWFGVSKRRVLVTAGIIPPGGADPRQTGLLLEIERVLSEVVDSGLAEYHDGWTAFRPTKAGIERARALRQTLPSSLVRPSARSTDSAVGERPSVFVGSSAEGLPIAEAIQANLDHFAEITIWHQGVFGLSAGTLETLVIRIPTFDFAILVLTPDDVRIRRKANEMMPRDNVLFELGLCIGALGRDRSYIVHPRGVAIELPSDLAGVTPATYAQRKDKNLRAALGAACTALKEAIVAARAR